MFIVELIGYIASAVILISVLSSSILRLRVINLIGSVLFAIYGFLIHSIPTGVMNTMIAFVNIYYLVKIFKTKEFFTILQTNQNDQYLKHFLDFYKTDVNKYYPGFDLNEENWDVSFYVLRDMAIAGVFLGKRVDEDSLFIVLDFVIPEYRDFKAGKYIYNNQKKIFGDLGYKRFIVYSFDNDNSNYLVKMGFVKDASKERLYVKEIN